MLPVRREQRYGRVGADSLRLLSESEPEVALPSALPPEGYLSPVDLQRTLDSHEPPTVGTFTRWALRLVPVLATLSWLGTLLALLLLWIFADGRARFDPSLGAVPFVSHIGARHQTVFLLGSIATATFYALSLVAERLLRHCRVLTEATEERLLWVAIGYVDVFVGLGAGLALVSTALLRAEDYPVEHAIAFIAFIAGISLSALLQTSEVEHLWHEHPDRHDLLEGTALKWICIAVSCAAGVAFCLMTASCGGDARTLPWPKCYRLMTASAILEWTACFGIAFYFSTLILDLWLPHRHALRASNPPIWADRTGVRGVLLASSSHTQAQTQTQTQTQTQRVHLPVGWALHRPKEGRARLVRRAPAKGAVDHPGWDEDGRDWSDFAWFEMGKRAGRRRKKEERER
ncbi:uncharacterized protein JCM10292_005195 [Rhodotorula paludigena]|uniref:uncharacterized protein n=1 Tax=Rhodotorula paludigena TaxID=86838 RepID=UPI0031706E15